MKDGNKGVKQSLQGHDRLQTVGKTDFPELSQVTKPINKNRASNKNNYQGWSGVAVQNYCCMLLKMSSFQEKSETCKKTGKSGLYSGNRQ